LSSLHSPLVHNRSSRFRTINVDGLFSPSIKLRRKWPIWLPKQFGKQGLVYIKPVILPELFEQSSRARGNFASSQQLIISPAKMQLISILAVTFLALGASAVPNNPPPYNGGQSYNPSHQKCESPPQQYWGGGKNKCCYPLCNHRSAQAKTNPGAPRAPLSTVDMVSLSATTVGFLFSLLCTLQQQADSMYIQIRAMTTARTMAGTQSGAAQTKPSNSASATTIPLSHHSAMVDIATAHRPSNESVQPGCNGETISAITILC
jgi:hypothetical protein